MPSENLLPVGPELVNNLQQALSHLRQISSPADFPARRTEHLRRFIERTTDEIRVRHRAGASGQEVVQALTAQIDAVVRVLYLDGIANSGGGPQGDFAILATGGYGRRALNPKSDIDLLFLFCKVREGDPITRVILHTLWDLHFDVGYSTRTVSECLLAAQDDFGSLTAMLEARTLAGDCCLARGLENALDEFEGTVLVVSHDRYFLDRVVDRIVELEDGTLTEYLGGYTFYQEKKQRLS